MLTLSYPEINFRSESLYLNNPFKTFLTIRKNDAKHLVPSFQFSNKPSLLSTSSVCSHIFHDYMLALLRSFSAKFCPQIWLHQQLDGRPVWTITIFLAVQNTEHWINPMRRKEMPIQVNRKTTTHYLQDYWPLPGHRCRKHYLVGGNHTWIRN